MISMTELEQEIARRESRLVLLGVLPHQVTLDMRRDLALAQLAEKAGEGRDGQGV